VKRVFTILATAVLLASLSFALAYPRFDRRKPWQQLQRDIPPPAGSPDGWICTSGDVGYVPRSRLPTKLGIAVGGLVVAAVLLFVAGRKDAKDQGGS
jgi:hypothetical protein